MKKIIILLFTFVLITSPANNIIYANDLIFTDDFGNSFNYSDSWSYKEKDLEDGYATYEFENKNGEILQLVYKESDTLITKEYIVSMCNESDGTLAYEGTYNCGGGVTWLIVEYENAVLFYCGTVKISDNTILYSIGISNAKTGEAFKLAKNIMSEISTRRISSNNVAIDSNDEITDTNSSDFNSIFLAIVVMFFIIMLPIFLIKKLIDKHNQKDNNSSINNVSKNAKSNGSNEILSALRDFNNIIFPNGTSSREHQKKQIKILVGDIPNTDDYLKIFIYCETHYLINKENYSYLIKMLPTAHPEIKDIETAKRVAAYTFVCAGTKFENIDLQKKENMDFINTMVVELDKQTQNIQTNESKNDEPFDDSKGLTSKDPLYFKGAKAAENYLNELTDLEGNKLHIGTRISYSVDGVNGMVDGYSMLKEDNSKYGVIYVSIYGANDCKYVPKGYMQREIKSNVKSNEIENKTKLETKDNSNISDTKNVDSQSKKEVSSNKTDNNNADFSAPIFCRKCGTKLDSDALFCRKCGTKVR